MRMKRIGLVFCAWIGLVLAACEPSPEALRRELSQDLSTYGQWAQPIWRLDDTLQSTTARANQLITNIRMDGHYRSVLPAQSVKTLDSLTLQSEQSQQAILKLRTEFQGIRALVEQGETRIDQSLRNIGTPRSLGTKDLDKADSVLNARPAIEKQLADFRQRLNKARQRSEFLRSTYRIELERGLRDVNIALPPY